MRKWYRSAFFCLAATTLLLCPLNNAAHAESVESNDNFRMRISTKPQLLSEDDVRAEIQFGREMASRVLGRYGYYDDEIINRYANMVASALALNMNRPELNFHVAVLKTDTINAYAAPGGFIFITRGAIMQMHDESELAAVIAHEMAHISGRHIVKELNIHASDNSPVSGFARFLGASGDPAKMTFINMVEKAMDILFEKGYKIKDEKEADTMAVFFLAMSGYDSTALSRYLDRIAEIKGENLEVLEKTHPSFHSRIALIAAAIENEGLDSGQNFRAQVRFNETIAIKPHELVDDDIKAEVHFGREVAARVLGAFGLYDNEELTRYVTMVGLSLALHMNRPEIEFRVAVLDTDEVHAFASPGGYIFVSRGALKRIEDEAGLAALIAHEMSHVAESHIVRKVNIHTSEQAPAAGFSRVVGTGEDEPSEALLSLSDRAVEILQEHGYDPEDEEQADLGTVVLLSMAGYDPEAFARMLQRFGTDPSAPSGKTDPNVLQRVERVQGVIESEGLKQDEYKMGAARFNEYKNKL